MTKQEKILLFVLACINFTHIVDFMIMMPLGPQLMRHFAIGPQAFGFIVSSYSLSAGISGFLAAFVVDRYPRNQVVMLAYAGFVIGTLACGLAPTYQLLIAARILAGVFGGVLGAQVLSIVGDVFAYERRAQAMSIVMTAFSAASVVGVPFGLYIATEFSWHAPFLAVGFLGIGVLALIWRFIPRLDSHLVSKHLRPNPIAVLTTIVRNPNQLRALWLTTTIMLGHFSIIPYLSPYLVSNVGFSESNIYLIYLVGGALTIFSAPMVGKLADRRGKFPIFVVFALLSLIPIYLITHMNPAPLAYVLFVAGLFFIFSNGRLVPTQAMTTSVVLPQNRGGFMAINSSVQLLAQALATYGAGSIIGKTAMGQLTHYGTVGFLAMAAIFSSIFIARYIKPVDAAPQVTPEPEEPVLAE
ncbi:MFS transporter [Salmonirosea aquatica]|uniref:MFS transporter n=1 Tax=Salmonirosea aquatica TaxID=2654236 RepID=A0A7C9BH80_9BACT|nr:MFS transporter [Cytophagaceae bacterium SJW1-29]